MTPELREALLKMKNVPLNEAGEPPCSMTIRTLTGTMVYQFMLDTEARVRQSLVLALDGPNLNKPDEVGRFYDYEGDRIDGAE